LLTKIEKMFYEIQVEWTWLWSRIKHES